IVSAETLRPGDRILLRPGESLPCDATLLSDSCEVEQSLLTGEFEPVLKQKGDLLLSGIRAIGEMELKIERSGETSALRQIQDMAASSLNDSPASQKYAETAGRWFVAFVLAASVGAFFYHLSLSGISHAIVVTVTLLIVACPCALNLAIPTAFIAGIQRSYSSGILFRSGQHLETIARAKALVFDKTGTLTRGAMEIVEEHFSRSGSYSDDQLRSLARTIESKSGVHHPVVSAFEKSFSHLPSFPFPSEASVRYLPGKGVQLLVEDRPVWLAGSFAWIEEELLRRSQELSPEMKDFRRLCEQSMRSAVVLAHCESAEHLQPLAAFSLEDALREDAVSVVGNLGNRMHLTILSGDSNEHVRRLAHQLQINEFRAEQSPEQKRDFVRQSTQREITLMVGDGINDSVALAAADTGISFAGGASLALHHSDVLLLNNRLADLEKMISIARSTRRKILQNLFLAFAYNGFLIPIAFGGFISPFLGAVFMSLSSITVIVNSLFAGRRATIR
ncbi:MAG: heavy metal translocating P-type ATPase, partial [Leptospiraceae bacterium]|nr:heavy metal translocating P-type ATPase [Leptospiraceae bacterium]